MVYLNDQDKFMLDSYSRQPCSEEDFDFIVDRQDFSQYYPPEVNQKKYIEYVEGEIQKIKIVDENKETENEQSNPGKNPQITISKKIVKPQQEDKKIKQLGKHQSKQKKRVYMFPGESKNIPKNFTRALKNFILNHFDSSVQQNPEIKKFLDTKQEKVCKQILENSLKNCQLLNQISQIFFGNLKWGTIFLEENKTQLEQYFRFNQIWFGSRN